MRGTGTSRTWLLPLLPWPRHVHVPRAWSLVCHAPQAWSLACPHAPSVVPGMSTCPKHGPWRVTRPDRDRWHVHMPRAWSLACPQALSVVPGVSTCPERGPWRVHMPRAWSLACPCSLSVVPGLPREGASAGRAPVDSTQWGQLGTPSQPSWQVVTRSGLPPRTWGGDW